MLGNTSAFCIDTTKLEPVETSAWIFLVASQYSWLPAAPATDSSASTSGTPAANMVDSVRVQRAITALRTSPPKTGMRSMMRSMVICTALERFHA